MQHLTTAPPPYSIVNIVTESTPLLNVHSVPKISKAPVCCKKIDDCLRVVDSCFGWIWDAIRTVQYWKNLMFFMLFLLWIALPISEIIYGSFIHHDITCNKDDSVVNYKLNKLDVNLWLTMDGIALLVITILAIISFKLPTEWKLNYIEGFLIFTHITVVILMLIWSCIGSVLVAKNYLLCPNWTYSNDLTPTYGFAIIITRISLGAFFYVSLLITGIMMCLC